MSLMGYFEGCLEMGRRGFSSKSGGDTVVIII